MDIPIQSHNEYKLKEAIRIAHQLAKEKKNENVIGIVFLGAIVKGYYDQNADIDIVIFYNNSVHVKNESKTVGHNGFEVHWHSLNYDKEETTFWDMAKRWAFSQIEIHHDPNGIIKALLWKKVPLQIEERRWGLMESIALSEWYCNRLTDLWISRGDLFSAQGMMSEGTDQFYRTLFFLNNELVPAKKWQYYCAKELKVLPPHFDDLMKETFFAKENSIKDLERRKNAFMKMWEYIKIKVETEVGQKYEDFKDLV